MNFAFYEHISTANYLIVETIGKQLTAIIHTKVSLRLSFIATNIQSFYLAANKFLLEDFIGFNDSQNNSFVVKRVLKLLNRTFKNYYRN